MGGMIKNYVLVYSPATLFCLKRSPWPISLKLNVIENCYCMICGWINEFWIWVWVSNRWVALHHRHYRRWLNSYDAINLVHKPGSHFTACISGSFLTLPKAGLQLATLRIPLSFPTMWAIRAPQYMTSCKRFAAHTLMSLIKRDQIRGFEEMNNLEINWPGWRNQ